MSSSSFEVALGLVSFRFAWASLTIPPFIPSPSPPFSYNSYSSLLGTDADWQYKTVEQTHAGNRVMDWPRGKVLGGSTAVNGMYLVRPSKVEIDTWATLAGPNGTENWGWEPMFRAMKKSERFTPPSDDVKTQGSIDYIMDNHGTNGVSVLTF